MRRASLDSGANNFTRDEFDEDRLLESDATRLSDGRTLIVGGDDGSGNLSSAELFG